MSPTATTRAVVVLGTALAVLAWPAAAGAQALTAPEVSGAARASAPPRLSLSLDGDTIWRLDRGYRLVSRHRAGLAGGVSLGADVGQLGRAVLALAVGWHGQTLSRDWANQAGYGRDESALELRTLSVSGIVRFGQLTSWLEPLVRVGLDATWADLLLSSDFNRVAHSHAVFPGGSVGAGLRLRTPTVHPNGGRMGLAGAVIVEGGVHLGLPGSYAVQPDLAPGDDPISARGFELGTLSSIHPYLRVSLAVLAL